MSLHAHPVHTFLARMSACMHAPRPAAPEHPIISQRRLRMISISRH